MNIKGIKKRWVFNSLGATIGIFALIIISFLVIVITTSINMQTRTQSGYSIVAGH